MHSLLKIIALAFPVLAFGMDFMVPGVPHFEGNRITYLERGEVLHQKRLELIKSAASSLYLSTFSLSTDEVGQDLFKLLCEKAKNGVDVRMVLNHHNNKNYFDFVTKLKEDCGAYVIAFRPGDPWYAIHEKLLIADGERMIMGGSGYSIKYAVASPDSHQEGSALRQLGKHGWYDSDYLVEGPAACGFHTLFGNSFVHLSRHWADYNPDFWWYGIDSFREIRHKYYGWDKIRQCVSSKRVGDERIIPTLGQPYKSKLRPIKRVHLKAIEQTKAGEEILLYGPYFVPGPEYVKALGEAAKRGVIVKIITNSVESTDEDLSNMIFMAMLEVIRPVLKDGVKVYLWDQQSTIHRKGGLYGKVAFFGSDNLDNRGQEYQSESVAFTDSEKIVQAVRADFERDLKLSAPLTQEYTDRIYREASWWQEWGSKLLKKYF